MTAAPPPFPPPALFALRDLLDPAGPGPDALWLKGSAAEPGGAAGAETGGGPRFPLDLAPGARLSTDTWFNAFPLAWWRAHARPDPLVFAWEGEGAMTVTVFHAPASGGPPALMARIETEGAGALPLPEPEPAAPGRLWAEIEARGPARLISARWATPVPPAPDGRLTVGLCAFGRETALTALARGLLEAAETTPALARVIVVNQGDPFADPLLNRLLEAPLFRVVPQPNLGGAGGFARGLAEALAAEPGPGHHLMMDDDIELDPRMIPRLAATLARLAGPTAIGGAMLDARAPGRMHEAGAVMGRHGVVRAVGHDADLSAAPADLLSGAAPVDFNGWWFFAVPRDTARAAGPPAPVFLRGDDTDYARRLAAAGAPTATPPGLGVWHEPFYAKATSWQHYYDLRNRLAWCAAHAGPEGLPGALDLLERIWSPALSGDHACAAWRMAALRDFLDGPAILSRPADAVHAGVLALAAGLSAEAAPPPHGLPRLAPGRPETHGDHAKGFARAIAGALVGLVRRPASAPFAVIPDREAAPGLVRMRAHVRAGREDAWFRLHRPRPGLALAQAMRALGLVLRYALRGRTAARAWGPGLDAARAPDAWAARFAAPRSPDERPDERPNAGPDAGPDA